MDWTNLEPAFPRPASVSRENGTLQDGDDHVPEQQGMTLFDHYIGKALEGYLANPSFMAELGLRANMSGMTDSKAIVLFVGRECVGYAMGAIEARDEFLRAMRKKQAQKTTPTGDHDDAVLDRRRKVADAPPADEGEGRDGHARQDP